MCTSVYGGLELTCGWSVILEDNGRSSTRITDHPPVSSRPPYTEVHIFLCTIYRPLTHRECRIFPPPHPLPRWTSQPILYYDQQHGTNSHSSQIPFTCRQTLIHMCNKITRYFTHILTIILQYNVIASEL